MARFDLNGNQDLDFGNGGHVSSGVGMRKFLDDLAGSGITQIQTLLASGDHLYFTALHPSFGSQLWVQPNGNGVPVMLTSPATIGSSGYISEVTDVGGQVLFHVQQFGTVSERELWKSNGTISGTGLVATIDDTEETYIRSRANRCPR